MWAGSVFEKVFRAETLFVGYKEQNDQRSKICLRVSLSFGCFFFLSKMLAYYMTAACSIACFLSAAMMFAGGGHDSSLVIAVEDLTVCFSALVLLLLKLW